MTKICPVCDREYEDEHIFCAADGTTLLSQGGGDQLIGTVIDDRYVIQSILGEGGMGRVYHGRHVHLPREVAIKVLHARLSGDPAAVARFNREAASASRIENPYVARVFDFGRMAGGATYLAMEFIPGRTLTQLLDDEGPLALPRVVHLVNQVANGLGAAHALGIVHRDLKPDNVIVMHDVDGAERAKIVDFGIAKATGDNADSTLTSAGFITGTPEYMSPEQFLGQTLDSRSDVFALGLLTFKLLTGALPFPAPSPERGFGAILTDAPRTLRDVAPGSRWSGALQNAFDRVLARYPLDRFASASEFADALQVALQRGDTDATDTPRSQPAAAAVHSPLSAAIPVAVSASRQSSATSDAPSDQRSRPETQPAASISSGARWRWPAVAVVATVIVALVVRQRATTVSDDTKVRPVAADVGTSIATAPAPVAGQPPATPSAGTTTAGGVAVPEAATGPAAGHSAVGSAASGKPAANPPSPAVPKPRDTNASGARPSVGAAGTTPSAATAPAVGVELLLDAVRDSLDALLLADENAESIPRARRLIARVDGLLPRSTIAGDSTRAYLLKANLQKLAGDRSAACRTLIEARPLATSAADRNSVTRNLGLWSC